MRRNRPATDSPAWRALQQAHRDWQCNTISRRRFLKGIGALSAGMMLPLLAATEAAQLPDDVLQTSPWPTLSAVQQQLFPADADGPGAQEIRAAAYLFRAMQLPRFPAEEREFILQGPGWLNELAQQSAQRPFERLDPPQQDRLLHQVAGSRAGENWLSLLLLYIFEALLTNPIYGGNPDGIGWRWLEHDPGFPQPTPANTFDRILKK
jgi:gluconate 2-dehydrogenase gamma chain